MSVAQFLSWLPPFLTALGVLGLGQILKAWWDHKRGMRKQTDDVAMTLVTQLSERLKTVEAKAAADEALCNANLAMLRHRVNNLAGSFDGLLLMIEMAPEKAAEFVARIKERRAQQEQAEAQEKAAIHAAVIQATAGVAAVAAADPE